MRPRRHHEAAAQIVPLVLGAAPFITGWIALRLSERKGK